MQRLTCPGQSSSLQPAALSYPSLSIWVSLLTASELSGGNEFVAHHSAISPRGLLTACPRFGYPALSERIPYSIVLSWIMSSRTASGCPTLKVRQIRRWRSRRTSANDRARWVTCISPLSLRPTASRLFLLKRPLDCILPVAFNKQRFLFRPCLLLLHSAAVAIASL